MNDTKIHTTNTFRRAGGAISLLLILFCSAYLAKLDLSKHTLPDVKSVPAVDWEEIITGLGYPLYEAGMTPGDLGNSATGNGSLATIDSQESAWRKAADAISLYARAAVLMDADTGRILYGKDELTEYPMASTTKIMTCIIALEYGCLEDEVTVSSYAASQPEVRLGIRAGERYLLRDLLYGTMLTSYNDCAAAVAEHIGGSVEGFADLMNQKARDLGCYSTWYITPNGLDAENEGGVHRTTAADLARVLSYAIKNEEFLAITRTSSHSFTDCSRKRSFTASNKNAFLSMMDGALSGKTGYTNDAGYCYAGALRRDGKTYVVALLGSGWPPQKNRKWTDTTKLMNFGLEYYELCTIGQENLVTEAILPVEGGITAGVKVCIDWSERTVLAAAGEQVSASVHIPEQLQAPAVAGAVIGYVQLWLEDEPMLLIPAVLNGSVDKFNFSYCIEHIFARTFDIWRKV